MRKHIFIVPFLFLLSIFSCKREASDYEREDIPATTAQGEIVFNLASSNAMVTKSQYQESDLKAIHNVWVLAVADDGFWRAKYYTESDFSREGDSVTCPSMNFKFGSSVTFYVTANMGDLTDAGTPGGVATPSGIEYMIPASVDFSASGMPMAAEPFTRTITANTSVSVLLEPLLARLNITIDKNGITDNTVADVLASGAIKVKHANRRLCPFGVSCALSPEHMFSVVVDTENFSSSVSYDMTHPNVVLYVPENSMGNLLGPGSYTQWDKGNQGAPGKQYATYIEYTGHKNAADDGIGGDLSYRAYLGENETSNYSVNRNTTYNCTLGLTWNGLFYTGDWRVDNSDITDGRLLTLSETPHTTSASLADWGRLRRNVASQLYVNFSRNGGSTWVHSAKDIDGWPYGWDLYIDGVKQAAGASATAAGDLGWAYTSAAAGDRIAITPGPSSVASSVHTLQVKSADGRVVSNVVAFQVSSPLTLAWDTTAPVYVAQRGRLYPTDLEDPSATVVYTITSGNTKVRLNSATNAQSTMVGLLAEGTATIHAECAATDQSGDMVINIVAPTLDWGGPLDLYAHPDGGDSCDEEDGMSGHRPLPAYYKPGEYSTAFVRKVGSVTTLAVNYNLASDLYDELLAFTPSVTSPLLKVSSEGYGDIILYVDKLTSGTTSYPLKQEEEIGELIVSPKSASTGVESISVTVYSVDPFSAYDSYRASPVSVDKSRDINDLSVINSSYLTSARTAWSIANTTYNVSFPAISGGNSYKGLEVFLNGSSASASTIKSEMTGTPGGTVSWPSMVTNRLSEDTAGVFELKGFVKNRYSSEKIYSPTFYKGRLFRHGAVVAYVSNPLDSYSTHAPWTTNDMRVSCRYFGKVSGYTSSGLAFAFPDVGTHRTNETYYIQWSDYAHDMYGYRGACKVKRNSAQRPVTDVNQYNEGVGYLFDVEDICGTASSYDVDIHGPSLNPHEAHDGYFCGDSSISGNTGKDGLGDKGAMMYFLSRSSQYPKYGSIRVANERLVFIKPDGSPTHNYSSTVTGCGYFVLHTFDGNGLIEDRWL